MTNTRLDVPAQDTPKKRGEDCSFPQALEEEPSKDKCPFVKETLRLYFWLCDPFLLTVNKWLQGHK